MLNSCNWYVTLETFVRGYAGSFVTHSNNGDIESVYVPSIYGTAQPSKILRGLGFMEMENYERYNRYYRK